MKLNGTLQNIRLVREDLSDYLYHFTKNANAFETLKTILGEGQLRDVNKNGVICFTEAPFPVLINMFNIFRAYTNPLYAPYGIAIKKSVLFDLGARPVIYGSMDEKELINPKLHWRFESYHPVHWDFTWLREWRLPAPSFDLESDDCFIITDKKKELSVAFNHEDIDDFEPDVEISDEGIPIYYMFGKAPRQFKGVSVQQLQDVGKLNNAQLADELLSQSFTDIQYVFMGTWNPEK